MYIKPENKGKFTATKKATGKSTTQLLHSKNAKTRSRANFARMAKRGFKKLDGGGELGPGDEVGNGIVNSGLVLKALDGIVKRNQYYKENLNNSQANNDLVDIWNTPVDPGSETFPGMYNQKRITANNNQVKKNFEDKFVNTYGRKPTDKDINLILRRNNGSAFKTKAGGGSLEDLSFDITQDPQEQQGSPIVKISDPRKTDGVTGLPLSDKFRKNAEIPTDYLQMIIESAREHKVDPYTALAIGLQETGFKKDSLNNPFMLGNYNPYGNIIDESIKFMADKNSMAKKLGKTSDEDVIQAFNGYGTVKNAGRMYGIDTNETPIDMNSNPVYGKRVVNLRDSVIKRNPAIVKMINQKTPFKYTSGGWIRGAAGGAASGAAMGTSILPGWGTAIGGVLGGVLGGIAGNKEDETSHVYQAPTSKERQNYDTVVAEGGMNLKQLSQRTDYKGEPHSQGGINLPIGAQVEGGESRTGDIVHSSKIKITPAIMDAFRTRVPLKKGDIGRSVADVVKSRDKRFEKRSGDEWNDTARKISQMPFEDMSNELAQDYQEAQNAINFVPDNTKMAKGGSLSKMKARMMLKDGTANGHPLTDKQKAYFGMIGYGAGGMDLKSFMSDEGNAPIIGGAMNLIMDAVVPVEKVKYQQTMFTPTKVTPISTEGGINSIRRTFGASRENLRRLNPRGYMNNLSNLSAVEAETIGNYTSGIQEKNATMTNQAAMEDSSNRSRIGIYNSQIAMEEAQAKAQNRQAKQNAIRTDIAGISTMMGQKARDEKLMTAQDKYQTQMYNIQKGYQDLWKDIPRTNNVPLEMSSKPDMVDPYYDQNNRLDEYGRPRFAGGGNIAHRASSILMKRKFKTS